MSTFAGAQRYYAQRGIVTIPVKADKTPAIRNWQKVGLRASNELAQNPRFADHATAIVCGPRNNITVLDIDSSDTAVLREADSIFGPSPVLYRTGSGNYGRLYKHSGERRHIKPIPGLPIDVLGQGYAIVPPSATSKGEYHYVYGSPDAVRDLPRCAADLEHTSRPLTEGNRNNQLFKRLLIQVRYCDDFESLLDVGRTMNMDCMPQLPDDEVVTICRNVWGYEINGKNWVGRKARASTDREEILEFTKFGALAASGFLNLLRVSHPEADAVFSIGQEKTAELMSCSPNTIKAWIRVLMDMKKLERIYQGGAHKGDPSLYKLVRS